LGFVSLKSHAFFSFRCVCFCIPLFSVGHCCPIFSSQTQILFSLSVGYCGRGELGDGTFVSKSVPTLIPKESFGNRNILSVDAGWYWSLAVDDLARIWTFGSNVRTELGAGASLGLNSTIPVLADMSSVSGGTITAARALGAFGFAIDDSGAPGRCSSRSTARLNIFGF
jgi:hypothetical protein